MSLDTLPPEIVHRILAPLDHASLKSLRQVSKALETQTSPLLFAHLEGWLQTRSLDRLTSIAGHEKLSRYVRCLTITNDFIPTQIITPGAFMSCLYNSIFPAPARGTGRGPSYIDPVAAVVVNCESFAETGFLKYMRRDGWPEILRDLGWPAERLFGAWAEQRDIAMSHARLLEGDEDVRALTKVLGGCLNLVSIRLSTESVGGPRRIRLNEAPYYFTDGDTRRADGRQFSALLCAAREVVSSGLSEAAKIESLILDEDFWHSKDYMYTGLNIRNADDFVVVAPPSVVEPALPFFSQLRTLVLPVIHNSVETSLGAVEDSIGRILAGLPHLQHLSIFTPFLQTLRLRQPLLALASTSIHTLKLQHCVLHLGDMQSFFKKNSSTLRELYLEMTTLIEGSFLDFFTSLREHTVMEKLHLVGCLVEIENDQILYFDKEERDKRVFYETRKRRNQARDEIRAFVLRHRDTFPSELLDNRSINPVPFSPMQEINVVIGASSLWDSKENDFS